MSTLSPSAGSTADSPDLEALFDSIAAANRETEGPDSGTAPSGDVVCQIGQLTRRLHDSLGALGYDGMLQNAAHAFPDARERLAYVASMAEQSAVRCLTAIEAAKPLQDTLNTGANGLAQEWDRLFQGNLPMDQFRDLALRTRDYLGKVPAATDATNAQLTEIMMAQDFQDLTGQVIKKITDMVQDVEHQLLKLLIDHAPAERRVAAESAGLLNGPVINTNGRDDVVTSQAQVDELLESLGF
jgi:chemotaxis protein CheZ